MVPKDEGRSKLVMVVEDEPAMREVLRIRLGQWGFEVCAADSVEAAERLLKTITSAPQAAFDLSCAGGCRAESEDGLVTVDNTVEARLQRAGAALQRRLSVFFESDGRDG